MRRLALALLLALPAWGLERVVLQLKGRHQFQFAGYYAAIEKGFYREAGLDVELREAAPGTDVIDEVVRGRAQFGVGASDLVLARGTGKPVVALAAILQHSPLVLIARQEAVPVVQSLAGKRVMIAPGDSELPAYLKLEGLGEGSYRRVPHSFDLADLILARYSAPQGKELLLFEAAEMARLMQPELIEIGHMNPGRWRHMAEIYADAGMLPAGAAIDGLVYDPRPPALPAWVPAGLFLGLVALVLAGAVAWRFAYFNRALNAEILARREAEQATLKEQAVRDGLTGLYNRRYLDETLERELARARRENLPLCMVLLDIDHFKQLNDSHGHQAGDEALKAVARALHHHVRAEDIVCRYGGEEFLILMPHIRLPVAAERAEGWRRVIEGIRLAAGGRKIRLTASLGVAAYPEHGRTPDELIRDADLALYTAKRRGRNRVVVYSPALDEEAEATPSRRSRDT